jgi:uncharacterized protein YodC (DUF2158 family)
MTKSKRPKIGDIVHLKSGSAAMSVVAIRRDGQLICAWFDVRDTVHRTALPAAALNVQAAPVPR